MLKFARVYAVDADSLRTQCDEWSRLQAIATRSKQQYTILPGKGMFARFNSVKWPLLELPRLILMIRCKPYASTKGKVRGMKG